MKKTTNPTMRIWDQVKITDPKHVSKKNQYLHTVDAMHNVERLTRLLGACGHGWGWKILRDESARTSEGRTVKEILLQLWWKDPKDGKIRECAPHSGTCAMESVDRNGQARLDEYYYKNAITEAFSKSTSLLGMSADVYFGMHDNPAYVQWARAKFNKDSNEQEEEQDNEDAL